LEKGSTTMKPKSFVSLLIVAVILGSAIGGALAGGVAIGKSQGSQTVAQYSSLPSGLGNITGQGNFQFPGNSTGIRSGNGTTVGTVQKVEGNVVTLNTSTGTILVNIGNSTSIQKISEGSLGDISLGESITISGNKNADGSIEARNVTITSTSSSIFLGGGGPG
jgi:hypothetical protein